MQVHLIKMFSLLKIYYYSSDEVPALKPINAYVMYKVCFNYDELQCN